MEDSNIKHLQLRLPLALYNRLRSAAAERSPNSNPNLQEFCTWALSDYLAAADAAKLAGTSRSDERILQTARKILSGGSREAIEVLRGVVKAIDCTMKIGPVNNL